MRPATRGSSTPLRSRCCATRHEQHARGARGLQAQPHRPGLLLQSLPHRGPVLLLFLLPQVIQRTQGMVVTNRLPTVLLHSMWTPSRAVSITASLELRLEYIMRNAGLGEAQAGIKIAGRNINTLRYADDTTLMAESEEELKSLLMKVKVESETVGLKLNIQKVKIMASGPITSWQIDVSVTLLIYYLQDRCSDPSIRKNVSDQEKYNHWGHIRPLGFSDYPELQAPSSWYFWPSTTSA
uniref:Reverse transcriptase domain-containing protein n=1 Tax=Bos indicus x Bos taurus TaxID=30522 RepID=A0A4W2IKT7_BOBOX